MQAMTANAITDSQIALCQRLDAYEWDQDEEFQGGLRAILGPVQDPAQVEHLTLRAKCYYYARKSGIPVDFDGYRQWIESGRSNAGAINGISDTSQPIDFTLEDTLPSAAVPATAPNEGEPTVESGAGGLDAAPKPASFAEICEMIAEGKPIPGIKDIPDTILEGQASESSATRRKKPWENGNAGAEVERPSWMSRAVFDCRASWSFETPLEAWNLWTDIMFLARGTASLRLLDYNLGNTAEMDSTSARGPQLVGFLDLPGELRNEIYQYALRSEKERRIVVKEKHNPDRNTYIKEQTPTLYQALPMLRSEIMSVYYASNSFRTSLTTPHRRELFSKWIKQRETQLKDLKCLKVGIKIQRLASKDGRQAVMQVGCSLQISLNADGQLDVLHLFQANPYCRLCEVNSGFKAYRRGLLYDSVAQLLARGSRCTERVVNPVIIVALGVCRTLDAVHKGEKEFKAVHWLECAGWEDHCRRCSARVEISVL